VGAADAPEGFLSRRSTLPRLRPLHLLIHRIILLGMKALRRHPSVSVAIAALVLILLATVIAGALFVPHFTSVADQLAAVAVVIAAATGLLAVTAGVLAAIAYAQSVRRPRLGVRVRLSSRLDDLFTAGSLAPVSVHIGEDPPPDKGGLWPGAGPLPDMALSVIVTNDGDAVARNVTVAVDIDGLQVWKVEANLSDRWLEFYKDPYKGSTRLQWDGGADIAIHPPPVADRGIPLVVIVESYARPGDLIRVHATVAGDGSAPASDTFVLPVE
jgi:hypothetical protein